MDFKFMWYANAMVVNSIMPLKKHYFDSFRIDILSKDVKDKHLRYQVAVGGEVFNCTYTFFSNVCAQGTLEIFDVKGGLSFIYGVERINDCIRLSKDGLNYNEMINYESGTILDIQIVKGRKYCVSCLQFRGYTEWEWEIVSIPTIINDEQRSRFDYSRVNELFTMTGAIDYKCTHCPDVVCFKHKNHHLTIYTEAKVQISITHDFQKDFQYGKVHPINADFKQYLEYTRVHDHDNAFIVHEYLINADGHSILKRKYTLINKHHDLIEIGETGKQFTVTTVGNDVTFTRV